MAANSTTFTDLGGSVSDLFAGLGATTAANLKAQGLDIEAEGTRISAQSLLLQSPGRPCRSIRIRPGASTGDFERQVHGGLDGYLGGAAGPADNHDHRLAEGRGGRRRVGGKRLGARPAAG